MAMTRRDQMLGDIRLEQSLGLEIGPLHAPLVRREEGRILYVDYASKETLQANFQHPGDPADIVDVDIIWGERPLRDCVGESVDYIVASHVIEHVPDLIGWLLELHAALKPGGIVGLAIPDRRFTFDVRRPVSLPGEMMEAYLRRHRQPSLRQLFESAAFSKDTVEPENWRAGEMTGGLPAEVLQRLCPARDLVAEVADNPKYVDAHCWIFTPASFLDTAQALHFLGYFPFVIEAFHPTVAGGIEFIVRLRAEADPNDRVAGDSISNLQSRFRISGKRNDTCDVETDGSRTEIEGGGRFRTSNGAGTPESDRCDLRARERRAENRDRGDPAIHLLADYGASARGHHVPENAWT
jgi:SAM-dependent methyltransferase